MLTDRGLDFQGDRVREGFTDRGLDFQGDRVRLIGDWIFRGIGSLIGDWIFRGIGSGRGLTDRGLTDRGLDFQGDRVREGFKGRVADRNGIGPLVSPNSHDSVTD